MIKDLFSEDPLCPGMIQMLHALVVSDGRTRVKPTPYRGGQNVIAKGKLSIHGVTRDVILPGSIEFANGNRVLIKSAFVVLLEDYDIIRPKVLWENIAEQITVNVDFELKPKM